jgi:hypothetical protein
MTTRRALTHADVRRLALALPEAEESAHMGTPDFRVRRKIFATIPPALPGQVNLKVTPANLDALTRRAPKVYRDVWGGRWMGVQLRAVTRVELKELLLDAWRLAAPKTLIRASNHPIA